MGFYDVEREKVCQMCGKTFSTIHPTQRYCSEECSKKAYSINQRRWRERNTHKKPAMTLDEKVMAAEAAGMTYGQWVLQQRLSGKMI